GLVSYGTGSHPRSATRYAKGTSADCKPIGAARTCTRIFTAYSVGTCETWAHLSMVDPFSRTYSASILIKQNTVWFAPTAYRWPRLFSCTAGASRKFPAPLPSGRTVLPALTCYCIGTCSTAQCSEDNAFSISGARARTATPIASRNSGEHCQ